MRARASLVALVVAAGLGAVTPVLAGGFMGSDAPSRIPVPARSFVATFEDVGGTTVQASRVTFDGEVFVHGLFGAAQVTVPFDRIAEVRIEKASDPLKRVAVVTLVDDPEPVRVEVPDDTPWYGRARFGNYKLEVRDLRAVRGFRAEAPETP
jgi:hypothetical protein